jgi:hypothetical protein
MAACRSEKYEDVEVHAEREQEERAEDAGMDSFSTLA